MNGAWLVSALLALASAAWVLAPLFRSDAAEAEHHHGRERTLHLRADAGREQ